MHSELANDLLQAAQYLLESDKREPKQADLRRAVSNVYYALFHTLAQQCADSFIGISENPDCTRTAWRQVYRALDHGHAKKACAACREKGSKFPREIQSYAKSFNEYQEKRHSADYDPFETFNKDDIADMIQDAQQVIGDFENVELRHRKAFAAFVLLKMHR